MVSNPKSFGGADDETCGEQSERNSEMTGLARRMSATHRACEFCTSVRVARPHKVSKSNKKSKLVACFFVCKYLF